jgi:hypothetical protein
MTATLHLRLGTVREARELLHGAHAHSCGQVAAPVAVIDLAACDAWIAGAPASTPPPCPHCQGWGRWGDDYPCGTCKGTGGADPGWHD